MLETKDLVKIYKPKRGVPVKALDGVTLKFPDTGMVFLTGKSGSGKSTLLNVLGGLDRYNSGQILIKGTSSKKFAQRHFDSYRNTYVGFIFQEYNILEEFSVGANIGLALQLQGRKATEEAINKILDEVDLSGYGNRRPNELSGGQKQRVAIARALVKEPRIIMADEPTGALDSNTGRQVLEMLKKLSKTRLVIVVSHDMDFANTYADRIIELADGRVIRDQVQMGQELPPEKLTIEDGCIKAPERYRLTEEDRQSILTYIQDLPEGAPLSFMTQHREQSSFRDTLPEDVVVNDRTPFKLIKSRLPLRWAFKLGAGGLKFKKFRLVMTIILSVFAFTMFGLADTLAAYDHVKNASVSIVNTGVSYAALAKSFNSMEYNAAQHQWYRTPFSQEQINVIRQDTGMDFTPAILTNVPLSQHIAGSSLAAYNMFLPKSFTGMIEVTQELLDGFGYEVTAGHLPEKGTNQIAISQVLCQTFRENGFVSGKLADGETKEYKISTYKDMLGKELVIGNQAYVVVGIVDTKFDTETLKYLTDSLDKLNISDLAYGFNLNDLPLDLLAKYNQLITDTNYSLSSFAMLGEGMLEPFYKNANASSGNQWAALYDNVLSGNIQYTVDIYSEKLGMLEQAENVYWFTPGQTQLGKNEILIDFMDLLQYSYSDGKGEMGYYVLSRQMVQQLRSELRIYTGNYNMDTQVQIVGIANVPEKVDLSTQWPENVDDFLDIAEQAGYDSGYVDDLMWVSTQLYISESLLEIQDNAGHTNLLMAPMPGSEQQVQKLVKYCYDGDPFYTYRLYNPINNELDNISYIMDFLSQVFLYIGLGFALFSSLLLANFITISISNKKQEIGVLRAIGSRGNDVFRIFLAESFIIAMISFVISFTAVLILCGVGNNALTQELGLQATLLNCGLRQFVLLFAISVAVAFIASFLPVKRIASKKPIDAIRNR